MFKSTRLNRSCLFHDKNQSLKEETRNICTIIGMFINAKYNGVIDDFTMDEVEAIAATQHDDGEFSYEEGAYTIDSNQAVLDYFDSKGIEYTCMSTKDDTEVLEWISRGYAIGIGIGVNREFFNDKKDGKVDGFDYSKYKGNIGHFCNFAKWTCRGEFNCGDNGKEMCIDSYFVTNSTYECDIKKVLEELDQPTKYIIF